MDEKRCSTAEANIIALDREMVDMRHRMDKLDDKLDSIERLIIQTRGFIFGLLVLTLVPDSVLDLLK
jgi:hypothetical protein